MANGCVPQKMWYIVFCQQFIKNILYTHLFAQIYIYEKQTHNFFEAHFINSINLQISRHKIWFHENAKQLHFLNLIIFELNNGSSTTTTHTKVPLSYNYLKTPTNRQYSTQFGVVLLKHLFGQYYFLLVKINLNKRAQILLHSIMCNCLIYKHVRCKYWYVLNDIQTNMNMEYTTSQPKSDDTRNSALKTSISDKC